MRDSYVILGQFGGSDPEILGGLDDPEVAEQAAQEVDSWALYDKVEVLVVFSYESLEVWRQHEDTRPEEGDGVDLTVR